MFSTLNVTSFIKVFFSVVNVIHMQISAPAYKIRPEVTSKAFLTFIHYRTSISFYIIKLIKLFREI